MAKEKIIRDKNLTHSVQWKITWFCNYKCSYCVNEKIKHDLGEAKSVNLILKNIKKKFDGNWEFVLSGGEPFLHNDFFKIVKELVKLGHRVSVVTNFSASPLKITRFLKLTGDKCGSIFASLHLEYATPDDFFKKISIIEKLFSKQVLRNHLFITSLATNKTIPRLEKIKKKFFEKGYQFYVQPYRYPGRMFFSYSDKQKNIIERISKKYNLRPFQKRSEFVGTYGLNLSKISFKGQKCWAGCYHFCMLPNGDAFRCFSYIKRKMGYLGNILRKDFKLLEDATKCQLKFCYCPSFYLQ